ncbi:MAG: glycosyltransferase family 4 protein [Calothrix sp. MO_192.B10]|nr:glycosyltransferase family 4 protein [Calothrix sp. MO_192.B10]
MPKKLRILYAPGPGNIIETYKHWTKDEDDPSQVAVTYSSQFYEVCDALDAQGYAIASPIGEAQFLHDKRFQIRHLPTPLRQAPGLLYHLGLLQYELQLIATTLSFRANVAVVGDGRIHWFILLLLHWLGVKVIPSLHCVLWCKYLKQSKTQRLLLKLNQHLFTNCAAILTASDDIAKQVIQITGGLHPPIVPFLPHYRRSEFAEIGKPDEQRSPFRVLFAGRIESNKGVFELLEIAKRFTSEGRHDIKFDICGKGSVLESLCLAVKEAGVDSSFVCHGHCNKPQMREMFNRAHVVIVPTRKDFAEGFNQVVVESILAGRPVVTSSVCPALSYVKEAVVEVLPEDTNAYGDALLKLCDDRQFYVQKQKACLGLQKQFYDASQSWGSVLKSLLVNIEKGEL